jgi:SAM-dependent methyltransferase
MSGADHWESYAERWATWARRPGFDSYWTESGPPFFEILPRPRRKALEVGCGEGRVTRDLKARGHDVVAVDASPSLLRLAREADPEGEYVLADAARLPFEDGSFDLVVAFNSLMDIDDMPGAVAEAARVLEPRGHFCICITHPVRDVGRFESRDRDAPLVIRGPYFGKRRFDETVERDGLEMRFRGWAYAIQDYTQALEQAGFSIESFREPPDPVRAFPNFLLLRTVRSV